MAARRPAAFSSSSSSAARRAAVRVQAADDAASASTAPLLEWPVDNESIKDVFAFAGSAPERVNGRVAMLGFVGTMLAEHSDKTPVLEQFGSDVAGVALLSVAITLASLFPKFASGSSLRDLHAAATGPNLQSEGALGQLMGAFDTNVELWSGRLAMVGVLGVVLLEAFTGNTLL